MERIETVAIIGMGALGLLFGQQIENSIGNEHFFFLMDSRRKERHADDVYRINGRPVSFRMVTPEEIREKVDLIIVATKYGGLYEARELAVSAFGKETLLVSLLNGISSEEILAESFPREQILDCVAIGMDAVREGTSLTYQNVGRWQIGSAGVGQEDRLADLLEFLERTGIPYEVCADIKKAMWNKFMINVGINQTCMVYETNYGGATEKGNQACEDMSKAMHEVMIVAEAEGITLTKDDFKNDMELLRSLNPEGLPSMRQDSMAGRPSEVELFSGTVLRIAKRHNIRVPVNERYYRKIREMEREKNISS